MTGALPRILLIEDEPLIALQIEEALTAAGFEIVGTAARLKAAMDFIEDAAFDAVILDANLGGVSTMPAAAALKTRNLPYVVFSGYLPKQQDKLFAGAPFVSKPAEPDQLIRVLRSVLGLPDPEAARIGS